MHRSTAIKYPGFTLPSPAHPTSAPPEPTQPETRARKPTEAVQLRLPGHRADLRGKRNIFSPVSE